MIAEIYLVNCHDPIVTDRRWLSFFSQRRIQKLQATHSLKEHSLSSAAEIAFVAALFGRHLPIPYQYDKTPQGKPVIPGNIFYFSLSHDDHWAACAIADQPIGVDIEPVDRPVSDAVLCRITSVNDSPKDPITLWTQKESFVKFTGEGLRQNFQELTIQNHIMQNAFNLNKIGYCQSVQILNQIVSVSMADSFEMNTHIVEPASLLSILTEYADSSKRNGTELH